jgi:rare lipoprotein A
VLVRGNIVRPANSGFLSIVVASWAFVCTTAMAQQQSPPLTDMMFAPAGGALAPSVPSTGSAPTMSGWAASVFPSGVTTRVTPAAKRIETGAVAPQAQAEANANAKAGAKAGARVTGSQHALTGIASYYWQDQMTATGERFDKTAMTAAHKTLPLNSKVKVTNLKNGRDVVVRINDRGPYIAGRVIDLSEAAAKVLGFTDQGLTDVRVDLVGK